MSYNFFIVASNGNNISLDKEYVNIINHNKTQVNLCDYSLFGFIDGVKQFEYKIEPYDLEKNDFILNPKERVIIITGKGTNNFIEDVYLIFLNKDTSMWRGCYNEISIYNNLTNQFESPVFPI